MMTRSLSGTLEGVGKEYKRLLKPLFMHPLILGAQAKSSPELRNVILST